MSKSKMIKIDKTAVSNQAVVALYVRVSTDKQREEGYSIDVQTDRLKNYAKGKFPNKEYKLYIDDGYSGGTIDRPKMNQLMSDIKNGLVDSVVVMKLDRLSRSQKDTLYLIEEVFNPHNVSFVSINESFDTSTPFGRAVVGILSVFAQLERENIFERTQSGRRKRVELGKWPGGGNVPFGYDYDREKGILVPNSDAETVRKMYDLYIRGYSMNHIAEVCGMKYDKLVQQILRRKSNAGFVEYKGEEFQGLHEPIVSLDTYEAAQAIMLDRSTKRFVSTTDHLLTGLVYCGYCGAKMRYQKWGKAGCKFVCYSQQTSKQYLVKDPDCPNEKPWAEDIEDVVIQDLFAMSARLGDIENEHTTAPTVLELLQDQHKTLATKLSRLYDLYGADGNSVLLNKIDEVKDQMDAVNKKIDIEVERAAFTKQINKAKETVKSISDIWEYMTVNEKQSVMRSVINRITVTGNHVAIDYKI